MSHLLFAHAGTAVVECLGHSADVLMKTWPLRFDAAKAAVYIAADVGALATKPPPNFRLCGSYRLRDPSRAERLCNAKLALNVTSKIE